jgi:hypothetical protein
LSPHLRWSASWWDASKGSNIGTIDCGLDINRKPTIVGDQFGNDKKSLDNQGECLVD